MTLFEWFTLVVGVIIALEAIGFVWCARYLLLGPCYTERDRRIGDRVAMALGVLASTMITLVIVLGVVATILENLK